MLESVTGFDVCICALLLGINWHKNKMCLYEAQGQNIVTKTSLYICNSVVLDSLWKHNYRWKGHNIEHSVT